MPHLRRQNATCNRYETNVKWSGLNWNAKKRNTSRATGERFTPASRAIPLPRSVDHHSTPAPPEATHDIEQFDSRGAAAQFPESGPLGQSCSSAPPSEL